MFDWVLNTALARFSYSETPGPLKPNFNLSFLLTLDSASRAYHNRNGKLLMQQVICSKLQVIFWLVTTCCF